MADNNIIFEKVWQDQNLIELKITAVSEFVKAYQNCYVGDSLLKDSAEEMLRYVKKPSKECYLVFGNKTGNFTPAFSMLFLPSDKLGHVKIEVDIEIDDNSVRAHRCCFYVDGELGLIDKLGKAFNKLVEGEIGEICSLNDMG